MPTFTLRGISFYAYSSSVYAVFYKPGREESPICWLQADNVLFFLGKHRASCLCFLTACTVWLVNRLIANHQDVFYVWVVYSRLFSDIQTIQLNFRVIQKSFKMWKLSKSLVVLLANLLFKEFNILTFTFINIFSCLTFLHSNTRLFNPLFSKHGTVLEIQ